MRKQKPRAQHVPTHQRHHQLANRMMVNLHQQAHRHLRQGILVHHLLEAYQPSLVVHDSIGMPQPKGLGGKHFKIKLSLIHI